VKYYTNKARQAGMTLIELTVVLLVLVGLAGIMIPYVTGFVGKTHDATGSSNIAEVGNAITRFETQFGSYPKNMDSLIVGADTTTGSAIDYTMCDVMSMAGCASMSDYDIAALPLTGSAVVGSGVAIGAEVCGSLRKAGLTDVVNMATDAQTDFNATFNNANSTTQTVRIVPMMGACTGTVAEIYPGKVATALGIDTTNRAYVIFGVGQRSQMVGKTMQEAPVHFAKNADMNASQAYNRFGAIFEVDRDTTTTVSAGNAMRARYVGTVMLMSDVVGLQSELANYYKSAADEAN